MTILSIVVPCYNEEDVIQETVSRLYALIGMLLGLSMAISTDHGQKVTHAHIMLAGFAVTSIFAVFYHLFPALNASRIANVHFWLQTVSVIVMTGSLFFLYGGNPAAGEYAAGNLGGQNPTLTGWNTASVTCGRFVSARTGLRWWRRCWGTKWPTCPM